MHVRSRTYMWKWRTKLNEFHRLQSVIVLCRTSLDKEGVIDLSIYDARSNWGISPETSEIDTNGIKYTTLDHMSLTQFTGCSDFSLCQQSSDWFWKVYFVLFFAGTFSVLITSRVLDYRNWFPYGLLYYVTQKKKNLFLIQTMLLRWLK